MHIKVFFYLEKYILWMIRIEIGSTLHWKSPTEKAELDLPIDWYEKYVASVPALKNQQLAASFDACIQLCKDLFNRLGASYNLIKILKEIEDTSNRLLLFKIKCR